MHIEMLPYQTNNDFNNNNNRNTQKGYLLPRSFTSMWKGKLLDSETMACNLLFTNKYALDLSTCFGHHTKVLLSGIAKT